MGALSTWTAARRRESRVRSLRTTWTIEHCPEHGCPTFACPLSCNTYAEECARFDVVVDVDVELGDEGGVDVVGGEAWVGERWRVDLEDLRGDAWWECLAEVRRAAEGVR